MTHITHDDFGAFFDGNSKVLILGSMPSPKSREEKFYYAHRQNRFWKVLPAIYGEDSIIGDIQRQKQFLTKHGIALWDVLYSCDIEGASDASIKNPVPNDIAQILSQAPIKAVFCTGKKAGQLYQKYCQPKSRIRAEILPSTSPANCAYTIEKLIEEYSVIKEITEKTED